MSQRTLDAHYQPNWRLTRAHGLIAYNCGYAKTSGEGSFASHQQSLVWQLLGDTPIGQDSVVLDVGCGIGGPAGWIMDRCGPLRIIGLEYLGSSVRAAEHIWSGRTHRPSFIQGDAHHIPLGDASVDVVFNLESALHYPDKPAFLSECRRVLKPGGTLCLGDITSRYKALFAPMRLINPIPIQFNSNLHLWRTQEYLDGLTRLGLQRPFARRCLTPRCSLVGRRLRGDQTAWMASLPGLPRTRRALGRHGVAAAKIIADLRSVSSPSRGWMNASTESTNRSHGETRVLDRY